MASLSSVTEVGSGMPRFTVLFHVSPSPLDSDIA